jgi:hypothetical protein
MLTERSLSSLVEISQQPYLSLGVKTIILMTYYVKRPYNLDDPDQEQTYRHDEFISQQRLSRTKQDEEMLTAALGKLPFLETIQIAAARGHKRNGLDAKCFGLRRFTTSQISCSFSLGHRLKKVIHAMANANARPLAWLADEQSLPVSHRQLLPVSGLSESSFTIPTHLETDGTPSEQLD